MAINADGLADVLSTVGEDITIGVTPSSTYYSGEAIVNGGQGMWMSVSGGTYEKIQYSIVVRKTDISFEPTPGMVVSARSESLRIPDNGVANFREHYRLIAVAANVPK